MQEGFQEATNRPASPSQMQESLQEAANRPASPSQMQEGLQEAASPSSSSSSSSSGSSVVEVVEQQPQPAKRVRNEPKPRRLFHLVFSCPKPENRDRMKTPESVGKEAFGKLVESKLEELWQERNKLLRLSVYEELHQTGEKHFHCPLLADRPFVPGPLERSLQAEGLNVYMESSHDFYWSLLLYLSVPTVEKPTVDRAPYLMANHPDILSCLQDVPRGASKYEKEKCHSYLGTKSKAKAVSRCMDHREFGLWIAANNLRTRTAVLHGMDGEDKRAAELYVFKFAKELEERIAFAFMLTWKLPANTREQASLWDLVQAAKEGDCVCDGKWGALLSQI
jgi:hypothetical protein